MWSGALFFLLLSWRGGGGLGGCAGVGLGRAAGGDARLFASCEKGCSLKSGSRHPGSARFSDAPPAAHPQPHPPRNRYAVACMARVEPPREKRIAEGLGRCNTGPGCKNGAPLRGRRSIFVVMVSSW